MYQKIFWKTVVLAAAYAFILQGLNPVDADQVINIPDPTLEADIRSQLGLAGNEPITDVQLMGLTSLDTTASDITGLNYANNLQQLQVLASIASPLDLSPLAGLSKLSSVTLGGYISAIANSNVLGSDPALKFLKISGGHLNDGDIVNISHITTLETIALTDEYDIHNINPIATMQSLRSVGLTGMAVNDFGIVSKLQNVSYLNLIGNGIIDASFVSSMSTVQSLWLGGNNLSSLPSLSSLQHLQILELTGNGVTDLSSLSDVVTIQELLLGNNRIKDISALSGLSNLNILDLGFNPVTNIGCLDMLRNLESVDLRWDNIADLSALENLQNLQSLIINGSALSQVSIDQAIPAIFSNNPGVDIEYEPVPEPGSIFFLFVGILAIKSRVGCLKHQNTRTKMKQHSCGRPLIVFVMVLAISPYISAKTWVGNNTGYTYWDDANNWNPRGVPTSSDDVTVTGGISFPEVPMFHSAFCKSLAINAMGKGLQQDSNSSMTIYSGGLNLSYAVYTIGVNASLSVTGGTLLGLNNCTGDIINNGYHWVNSGILSIGESNYGTGIYNLNSGGYLSVSGLTYIGRSGNGVFNHQGNAYLPGGLVIGCNTDSNGIYTLNGTSAFLTASSGIVIGYQQGYGQFKWYAGNIDLGGVGVPMTVTQKGTLSVGFGQCDLGRLLDGNYFQRGSLAISSGNLECANSSALSHPVGRSISLGSLKITSGTYDYVGSGTLCASGGVTVGAGSSAGAFIWRNSSGHISLNGSSMVIGQNGTLQIGFNTDLAQLLSGGCFQDPNGSVDLSNGTLMLIGGCSMSESNAGNARVKSLSLQNGNFLHNQAGSLDANAISVATDGNQCKFTWDISNSQVKLNSGTMTIGANGTLEMCHDFTVGTLLSGGYFYGAGQLSMSTGKLLVNGGATATHDDSTAATFGHLTILDGNYELDANGHIQVSSGIDVGTDGYPCRFDWNSGSAGINLSGSSMTVGSNGTLAVGFNFTVGNLLSGAMFDNSNGSLSISNGVLEVPAGVTATQSDGQSAGYGSLNVLGSYSKSGSGSLSVQQGIRVGSPSQAGRFEWLDSNSQISLDGNTMALDANSTLALGYDFSLPSLMDGNLFTNGGTLDANYGIIEVVNGATCTVDANQTVTVANLKITNGTLSLGSGACLIVTNSLILDANLITVDANATIIIQPPLGASSATLDIGATDANAVAGLGNITLKCQFDPDQSSLQTVNLEVAGQDPNLQGDNFCTSNFVIGKVVVGRADANDGEYGTSLNLVNNHANGSADAAVYAKVLSILYGGVITLNDANFYYQNGDGSKRFMLGDANLDGKVDGQDYLIWQRNYHFPFDPNKAWANADFNADRIVDGQDYLIWQLWYGLTHKSQGSSGQMGQQDACDNLADIPFDQVDLDGDGFISMEEAAEAFGPLLD